MYLHPPEPVRALIHSIIIASFFSLSLGITDSGIIQRLGDFLRGNFAQWIISTPNVTPGCNEFCWT